MWRRLTTNGSGQCVSIGVDRSVIRRLGGYRAGTAPAAAAAATAHALLQSNSAAFSLRRWLATAVPPKPQPPRRVSNAAATAAAAAAAAAAKVVVAPGIRRDKAGGGAALSAATRAAVQAGMAVAAQSAGAGAGAATDGSGASKPVISMTEILNSVTPPPQRKAAALAAKQLQPTSSITGNSGDAAAAAAAGSVLSRRTVTVPVGPGGGRKVEVIEPQFGAAEFDIIKSHFNEKQQTAQQSIAATRANERKQREIDARTERREIIKSFGGRHATAEQINAQLTIEPVNAEDRLIELAESVAANTNTADAPPPPAPIASTAAAAAATDAASRRAAALAFANRPLPTRLQPYLTAAAGTIARVQQTDELEETLPVPETATVPLTAIPPTKSHTRHSPDAKAATSANAAESDADFEGLTTMVDMSEIEHERDSNDRFNAMRAIIPVATKRMRSDAEDAAERDEYEKQLSAEQELGAAERTQMLDAWDAAREQKLAERTIRKRGGAADPDARQIAPPAAPTAKYGTPGGEKARQKAAASAAAREAKAAAKAAGVSDASGRSGHINPEALQRYEAVTNAVSGGRRTPEADTHVPVESLVDMHSDLIARQKRVSAGHAQASGSPASRLGLPANPDDMKVTALHRAAKAGDEESVIELIARDQKLQAERAAEAVAATAAPAAAEGGSTPSAGAKPLPPAQSRGLVNGVTPKGMSAMMHAAENGYASIVKVLIEAGANINQQNVFGETGLMLAAKRGQTQVVKALLAAGDAVSVRHADSWGNTALMYAAKSGNWSCIELLLPQSDASAVNVYNQSAFVFAAASGDLTLIEFLKSAALNTQLRAVQPPEPGTGTDSATAKHELLQSTLRKAAAGGMDGISSDSTRARVHSAQAAEMKAGPLTAALGVQFGRFGTPVVRPPPSAEPKQPAQSPATTKRTARAETEPTAGRRSTSRLRS